MDTERLLFRHYIEKDKKLFVQLNCDPIARKYMDGPKSEGDACRLFMQLLDYEKKPGKYAWAVLLKETNKYIGHCFLTDILPENRAEIGFILFQEFWGKGLATEIATTLIQFGFQKHGFNKLIATVDTDHLACIRVLEKSGLHLDSRCRDEKGDYLLYTIKRKL